MSPSRPSIDAVPQQVRRRAPMNSVSTRIILCVFFSTMLTALIVSWLSIGAIHNDVGARVEQRTRLLLEARRGEIELWHSAAAAQLAASTAIGTSWHTELLAQVDGLYIPNVRILNWASADVQASAAANGVRITNSLRQPPEELVRYFDQLRLRRAGAQDREPLECF